MLDVDRLDLDLLKQSLQSNGRLSGAVNELGIAKIRKILIAVRARGTSFQEMAGFLGVPKSTLSYWAKKLGVDRSRVIQGELMNDKSQSNTFLRRIPLTSSLAYLIGLIVGDGSITKDGLRLTNTESSLIHSFESICHQEQLGRIYTFIDKRSEHKRTSILYNRPLARALGTSKVKIARRFMSKSNGKGVSSHFIAGYYDAEGGIDSRSRSITLGSTSKPILALVQRVLEDSFGITSRIYLKSKAGDARKIGDSQFRLRKNYWCLYITSPSENMFGWIKVVGRDLKHHKKKMEVEKLRLTLKHRSGPARI